MWVFRWFGWIINKTELLGSCEMSFFFVFFVKSLEIRAFTISPDGHYTVARTQQSIFLWQGLAKLLFWPHNTTGTTHILMEVGIYAQRTIFPPNKQSFFSIWIQFNSPHHGGYVFDSVVIHPPRSSCLTWWFIGWKLNASCYQCNL